MRMFKRLFLIMLVCFTGLLLGCHKHEWEEVDCQTPIACKICGKVKAEAGPHVWSDEGIVKEATCEEDGLKQRSCTVCGITEDIVIEKLGHEFEDVKVLEQPTCEKDGKKKVKCKRCSKTEEVAIEKLPHEYVDYICKSCGYEDRPKTLNLTSSEKSKTDKVKYISSINCEYKDGKVTFFYCLMDDKKEEIIVPTFAKITIRNKDNVIKYNGYKRVDGSGTLTIFGDTKLVNMTTISPVVLYGKDWEQLGTLEYEIFSPGKWSFDKDTISIYD